MALVTKREGIRALLITTGVLSMSIFVDWLSVRFESPAVWRFVITWILVVILFRWDTLRSDLHQHREQIKSMLARDSNNSRRVAEQAERSARIAQEIATRNEQSSQERHEQLPERIAQFIADKDARATKELKAVAKDTNVVVHEVRDVIRDRLDGAPTNPEDEGDGA
jgi:hypothetical protein